MYDDRSLNIQEVEAFSRATGANVAFGQPVSASSTHWIFGGGGRMVDGSIADLSFWSSALVTPCEALPYAEIDLGQETQLCSVRYWGRYWGRSINASLFLLGEGRVPMSRAYTFRGDSPWQPVGQPCTAEAGLAYVDLAASELALTPSSTASPSPSITASGTSTPTASPSSSRSRTGTQSQTRSSTASRTRTATVSPTASRTPTASPPICRGMPCVIPLSGTSGSVAPLSTAAAGCPGMYTSGSCATGFRSFFPGTRLVFSLYLGRFTMPGGTLTVTTCGATANDTVLYIGTGCPKWADPFGCLAGNDNAPPGSPGCGVNALASKVVLPGADQRTYFVQLGGLNGEDVTSGLAWAYTPPSASPSGTRTGSRTRSVSASRSRSRKPK